MKPESIETRIDASEYLSLIAVGHPGGRTSLAQASAAPTCPQCDGPLIQPTWRGKSAQPLWCGKCERGFDWCALDARLRRELATK
ncbi:MAG: hypothetical protein VB131_10160 [Burkholderia gladioli]